MIDIGNVLVIITIVSVKQVYNGKVKLFNEIEPLHFRAIVSNFSVVRPNSCRVMCIENLG